MNKEKKIQEESKLMIDELSKMPPMVIVTAYLHALNYTLYGEDVTKAWVTAVQQHAALEKAYRDGCCDALKRQKESEDFRYSHVLCGIDLSQTMDLTGTIKCNIRKRHIETVINDSDNEEEADDK